MCLNVQPPRRSDPPSTAADPFIPHSDLTGAERTAVSLKQEGNKQTNKKNKGAQPHVQDCVNSMYSSDWK